MIKLPLAEVARVVGGTLAGSADPGAIVSAVVVDSRAVVPGALFAAFPGERADGADFAAEAVVAGAVAVLATRPLPVPTVVVSPEPGVDEPGSGTAGPQARALTSALGRLARATLDRLPQAKVVAVTGSSGKTTTKDLLASVLEPSGPTVAAVGSHNNDLGLPLTVLGADERTSYLVLEMGARGTGHICRLCAVAPPSIGIVLNVGTAHLGEFGAKEIVAQAKGELVEAARDCAVLNADDPLVRAMRARAQVPVVTFGESPGADVRAEGVRLNAAARASFRLVAASGSAEVALQLVGAHQVGNALAAAAAALRLGVGIDDIATRLGEARPRSRWRMEVHTNAAGVTVVNDAYNANPESMRAALKALAEMTRARRGAGTPGAPGARSWAVLGELAELGEAADAEHDALGRFAVRLNIDTLVVVGRPAARIHSGACLEGSWSGESVQVAGAQEASELVRAQSRPGDVVLVKASRVAGLERVAAALLDDPVGAT